MQGPATKLIAGAIVVGAFVAGGAYILESASLTPACSTPLTYRIGSVDERFGVSETELRAVLREAALVWNTAAGKTIIAYSEDGDVPVSLAYDERQATAQLGSAINSDQAAYEKKRDEVDLLIASHESRVEAHDAALASFERAKSAYDAEVASWNRQGGAPPGEYEKLENTRRSLERKQQEINAEAVRLNRMIADINMEVQELNMLAEKVNRKVDVYNEVAGEEFDQGQYIEDANGARITVYEFRTREQLVRVMAHEFGHALGILHTDSPQSLMYPYNSGGDLELHAEDIAALNVACELE
ncbi:MAG TPA: matrixin family metalloprotease [Candidatus Paceibacterota bacterium]|nr:matrixin family metalloprotease [Candidatus Paceibacterota bacterium]